MIQISHHLFQASPKIKKKWKTKNLYWSKFWIPLSVTSVWVLVELLLQVWDGMAKLWIAWPRYWVFCRLILKYERVQNPQTIPLHTSQAWWPAEYRLKQNTGWLLRLKQQQCLQTRSAYCCKSPQVLRWLCYLSDSETNPTACCFSQPFFHLSTASSGPRLIDYMQLP